MVRSPNSFITGGSGTANLSMAARLKAMGLPYQPSTVDPAKSRASRHLFGRAGRVDDVGNRPAPAAGRIESHCAVKWTDLFPGYVANQRPHRVAGALIVPRVRLPRFACRFAVENAPDRGCKPQSVQIYATAISADALSQLFPAGGRNCSLDQPGWMLPARNGRTVESCSYRRHTAKRSNIAGSITTCSPIGNSDKRGRAKR